MRAHTHCPVPGDTMTELDPARGQRAHFFGEGSGNQALLHKHSDFNNTTEHICTTTTLISPFLLGDSLSEGGKKSVGCVCPSSGSVPNPCGLWCLIDSVLEGCSIQWNLVATCTYSFFISVVSFLLVLSPPLGENPTIKYQA